MVKGSRLVLKTVEQIANETVVTQPQAESASNKSAPKIFKDTCEINWQLPFTDINNFVRGLNPYPTAWTIIDGKTCKIFATAKASISPSKEENTMITDHKTKIYFRCADGWVDILELQMEGKKRMKVEDFLRGNPLAEIPDV